MTIKEQIKTLEKMIDKGEINLKNSDDVLATIELSKEIAVLKDVKTKLLHSIGAKTEEETEHERCFE